MKRLPTILLISALLLSPLAFSETTEVNAVVRPYTKENGSIGRRIEIKTIKTDKNGYQKFDYRTPTPSDFLKLLDLNPAIEADLQKAMETDEPARELLKVFEKDTPLDLDYQVTTLSKIANAMNAKSRKLFGASSNGSAVGNVIERPTVKNSAVKEVMKGVGGKDTSAIDEKKLEELLKRKQTDLKGKAAKSEDIKTLYDALAILLADKRCGLKRVKSKQKYLTKGIDFSAPLPIDIDPNSVDIGGGSVKVHFENPKRDPIELGWDANHFTEMSVADWLYGHPNGPSNGHVGFYKQLKAKGIGCYGDDELRTHGENVERRNSAVHIKSNR